MKKHLLITTLLCLSTTACVPALLVGGGAVAGSAIAKDSRSLQTMSDDNGIEFQAIQKLRADQKLYGESHITVTVFNHILLLTGEVPSAADRAKAESLVQSVPDVSRVYNQLKIAQNIGTLQAADDVKLAANIKTRMMLTSNLNSDNFKIVVENGVVYVMGLATREQANIATDVIRNSSGVQRVVKLIQYKNADGSYETDSSPGTATGSDNTTTTPAASNTATSSDSTKITPAPKSDSTPTASSDNDVSFTPVESSGS